jgi:hypothetical protein
MTITALGARSNAVHPLSQRHYLPSPENARFNKIYRAPHVGRLIHLDRIEIREELRQRY